jgi:hypothetical protein
MAEAEPLATSPADQATCDKLYAELKPMAANSGRYYIIAHTPVYLQAPMLVHLDADFPLTPLV